MTIQCSGGRLDDEHLRDGSLRLAGVATCLNEQLQVAPSQGHGPTSVNPIQMNDARAVMPRYLKDAD
jgi:hypothetical protein